MRVLANVYIEWVLIKDKICIFQFSRALYKGGSTVCFPTASHNFIGSFHFQNGAPRNKHFTAPSANRYAYKALIWALMYIYSAKTQS